MTTHALQQEYIIKREGECPTLYTPVQQLLYEFMTFYYWWYLCEMSQLVLGGMAKGHELIQQLLQ